MAIASMLLSFCGNAQSQENGWVKIVTGRHELSIKSGSRGGYDVMEVKQNFPGYVQIQMSVLVSRPNDSAQEVPVLLKGMNQVMNTSVGFLTSNGFGQAVKINSFKITYSEFGLPYALTYDAREQITHLYREGRLMDYLAYFQVTDTSASPVIPVQHSAQKVIAQK